jgi:hypothetical protein
VSPERTASEASGADPVAVAQAALAPPAAAPLARDEAAGDHGRGLGQGIRSGVHVSNRALSRWMLQRQAGDHGRVLGQAIRSGVPVSNRALSRWMLQRQESGDDLRARARQALAGVDWSSAATDILERIVNQNFPELRASVTEFRWDPAAAQTGSDDTGRAVRMVDGALVGGDLLVRWVANGFLKDAVAEVAKALKSGAAASTPAAPAAPAAPATRGAGYRAEIVKLINSIPDEGITETKTGGLKGFMTAEDIAYNRKKMGAGWTSCIGFQGSVLEQAKTAFLKRNKSASVYTNVQGSNAEKNAPAHHAWFSGGSGYQPQPGDMYRLNFADKPTEFSHVGFIKEVKPGKGDIEHWVTVDGGQRLQRGDPDKITLKTRPVDRKRQVVQGGENADPNDRILLGFVNVENLVS